jgi:hypothetical protein
MNPTVILWIENLIIMLLGLFTWLTLNEIVKGRCTAVPAVETYHHQIRLIRRLSFAKRPPGREPQRLTDDKQYLFFTSWGS